MGPVVAFSLSWAGRAMPAWGLYGFITAMGALCDFIARMGVTAIGVRQGHNIFLGGLGSNKFLSAAHI